MRIIQEHINSNSFKNFYLIYGEEIYLKEQFKKKLRETIIDKSDTMNYSYYEGKDIDINRIEDIANTLPLFAERRLIIIEDSGIFKADTKKGEDEAASSSSKPIDRMAKLLDNLPESTYIVFVEEAVDKRNRLFKKVSAKGYAAELSTPNEEELSRWIAGILQREGKSLSSSDIVFFIRTVGNDMVALQSELEKLIMYTLGRKNITREDITKITTVQLDNKIFDMISAISTKNQSEALRLYNELYLLREPVMKILYLIIRQYNTLIQIVQLRKGGLHSKEIATRLGMSPYIIDRNVAEAKNLNERQIEMCLRRCIAAETNIKTGKMDEKVAIEALIVELSSKN